MGNCFLCKYRKNCNTNFLRITKSSMITFKCTILLIPPNSYNQSFMYCFPNLKSSFSYINLAIKLCQNITFPFSNLPKSKFSWESEFYFEKECLDFKALYLAWHGAMQHLVQSARSQKGRINKIRSGGGSYHENAFRKAFNSI